MSNDRLGEVGRMNFGFFGPTTGLTSTSGRGQSCGGNSSAEISVFKSTSEGNLLSSSDTSSTAVLGDELLADGECDVGEGQLRRPVKNNNIARNSISRLGSHLLMSRIQTRSMESTP